VLLGKLSHYAALRYPRAQNPCVFDSFQTLDSFKTQGSRSVRMRAQLVSKERAMKRREFLGRTTAFGAVAGISALLAPRVAAAGTEEKARTGDETPIRRLSPPAKGNIHVAFVISPDTALIDFAGPWEVFSDVHVEGRGATMDEIMPFRCYTVSDRIEILEAGGGLKVLPDFTFGSAPAPHVVVIPAQRGRSDAMLEWIRANSQRADVTMSVCTGAFVLGKAGLLDGLLTTTHHNYQDKFAELYPKAKLQRGVRFVENDRISSAGGLSSGIDLALHVVERYFGRDVAQKTADYLEYQGLGWKV
jgi:putative intracellular protease/amidase